MESEFKHYSDFYDYEKTNNTINVPLSKHIEPLAFYNQAFNGTDETAFLYYYKVLEYFFTISKKEKIECDIEVKSLERVLHKLNVDNYIEIIIDNDFCEYMLDNEDRNNIDCNNVSIKTFVRKLYKYRNSVVHGKKEEKLLSHVPMNLADAKDIRKLEGWNSITNKLAYACIEYFCFDGANLFDFIKAI